MKNNKSALVELRNNTIIWCIITIVLIVLLWFSYNFFTQLGNQLVVHNQKKVQTITNIVTEGIISDQVLSDASKDDMRWQTIQKLVPGIKTTIGVIGTPDGIKNIATIKKITQKGDKTLEYKEWLKTSWDAQSKENLDQMQKDIAEIIPIFAGVSSNKNTENISGKITLKKLIDFIQIDIAKKYHLGNAMGAIGINSVKFIKEGSDIGAYDIPLKFDNIDNKDVLQLLDFLSTTGGIKIQKKENGGFSITHTNPRELRRGEITGDTVSKISQLKNPLIIVQNIVINPSEKDVSLITETSQKWDINMTLTFYIRGASSDFILKMDQNLIQRLGEGNTPGTLLGKANQMLQMCQKNLNCSDENKIADLINLLSTAKNTYKGIRDADQNSSPIAMVTRRSDLMSTVTSLEKKLQQIESDQKANITQK
ncbi:MAG: hypothetical protein WC753_01670 [Candidatus Gracilibacteria bacterium]